MSLPRIAHDKEDTMADFENFVTLRKADLPTLPEYATLTLEDISENCDGSYYRVETVEKAFPLEVAYWASDGSNDILRGENGTLQEVAEALVAFTWAVA